MKVCIGIWILAVAKNVRDEERESKKMGMLFIFSSLQDFSENSCDKEKALDCP